MFIDSHCHLDMLDLSRHDNSLDNIMAAARERQVGQMLCVCVDLNRFDSMVSVAQSQPNVWFSAGIHPLHVEESSFDRERLAELAQNPRIVALGETGLDYHYTKKHWNSSSPALPGTCSWRPRWICP